MKKTLSIILSIILIMTFAITSIGFTSTAVKSIKLSVSNITLQVGKTYILKVTITPANATDKKLTYSSGNKSIATVDKNGNIKGIKAGKTVITVTSSSNKKAVAKCNVTISQVEKLKSYKFTYLTGTNEIPMSFNSTQTRFGKILKEKFNVEIDFVSYAGDWNEKCNLMLAAGDYGEMLWLQTNEITVKYAKAGALLPLDPYLDKMPSFTGRTKEQIKYWRLVSDDGKLYKWEQSYGLSGLSYVPNDIGVRTDALEAAGWPNLLSEDSYIDFLKEALKKFPTINGKKTVGLASPFAEPWGIMGLANIGFEKGGYTNIAMNNGVIWDNKNNKYMHYQLNPYVKDTNFFLNKAYRAGVLDKEIFTDHLDQFTAKMNAGIPIASYYACWLLPSVNNELIKAGHPEMQYINMPLKLNNQIKNNEKRVFVVETTRPFQTHVITKHCKNPERIAMIIDFISSEEGQILAGWGQEGIDYKIKDGIRVSLVKSNVADDDPVFGKIPGFNVFPIFGLSAMEDKNGQNYTSGYDSSTYYNTIATDRMKEAYNKLGWKNQVSPWRDTGFDLFQAGLIGSIALPGNSKEAKIEQKMMQLRAATVPKLILAKSDEEFEKVWSKFMEDYKKLNPDVVVDKYNELYNSEMAKLNK